MHKFLILVNTAALANLIFLSAVAADPDAGEQYFRDADGGNCVSCHYTDNRRLVGPGLKEVTRRHSEDWLLQFLQDPQQTWRSDHPETIELKKRVRKTRADVTTCKKQPMSSEQLQDLLEYLKTL